MRVLQIFTSSCMFTSKSSTSSVQDNHGFPSSDEAAESWTWAIWVVPDWYMSVDLLYSEFKPNLHKFIDCAYLHDRETVVDYMIFMPSSLLPSWFHLTLCVSSSFSRFARCPPASCVSSNRQTRARATNELRWHGNQLRMPLVTKISVWTSDPNQTYS